MATCGNYSTSLLILWRGLLVRRKGWYDVDDENCFTSMSRLLVPLQITSSLQKTSNFKLSLWIYLCSGDAFRGAVTQGCLMRPLLWRKSWHIAQIWSFWILTMSTILRINIYFFFFFFNSRKLSPQNSYLIRTHGRVKKEATAVDLFYSILTEFKKVALHFNLL